MKTLLALDLSTTACGWSHWDIQNEKLLDSGTILTKTESFKDNFYKIDFLVEQFKQILGSQIPSFLFVEEALVKLSGGGSSAGTIAKLIQMNFAGTYAILRSFGDECSYGFIDVRKARKSLGIKVPRGANAKLIVFDFVSTQYPEIVFQFKKTGKPKDFEFDRCDAIVLGLAALKLNLN